MYREFSFNLTEAIPGIAVSVRRPVETMSYGAGFANAESIAKGGDYFQQHRQSNSPTYVANVLPTENGYVSVGKELCELAAIAGGSGKLGFVGSCLRDNDFPVIYNAEYCQSLVQLPSGTVMLADGIMYEWHTKARCRQAVNVRGIDLQHCALVGLSRIGQRLIAYSKTEIYVSSAEDRFDFTPSLRTQAQAFSIGQTIGSIVTVIAAGDIVYVLGKTGGVALVCTGDSAFTYKAELIDNFNGIEHPLNCQVDYATKRVLCWSKSGLMWLEGNAAIKSWADVSQGLREGRVVVFDSSIPAKGLVNAINFKLTSPNDNYATAGLDHTDTVKSFNSFYLEARKYDSIVAVRNASSRYVFISYANSGNVFNRVFVYDKWLERSSVLHVQHTDIACGAGDDIYICHADGNTYRLLRENGIGLLYWDRYTSTNRRAVKITGIAAYGDFDSSRYKVVKGHCIDTASIPNFIPCIVGQDISYSNAMHGLRLLTSKRNDLLYSGLVVGHQLAFVFGFVGRLNELVVRRPQ